MTKHNDRYLKQLAELVCHKLEHKVCYRYEFVPTFNHRARDARPHYRRDLIQHSALTNRDTLKDKLIQAMQDVEEGVGIQFDEEKIFNDRAHFLGIVDALVVNAPIAEGCFPAFLAVLKDIFGVPNEKQVVNIDDIPRLVAKYAKIPLKGVPSLMQLALKAVKSDPAVNSELEAVGRTGSSFVDYVHQMDRGHFRDQVLQSRAVHVGHCL